LARANQKRGTVFDSAHKRGLVDGEGVKSLANKIWGMIAGRRGRDVERGEGAGAPNDPHTFLSTSISSDVTVLVLLGKANMPT